MVHYVLYEDTWNVQEVLQLDRLIHINIMIDIKVIWLVLITVNIQPVLL